MSAVETETPAVEKVEEVKEPDVVETIEPSSENSYVRIGKGEEELVYTQRPLSFFGKMELFSLLGSAIDDAMKQGDISLVEIFGVSDIGMANLDETDVFIKAVAKLVQFAPEFLKDLYCVALGVARGEREYVKMLMEAPEEEGGLSDELGIQILNTFVDQNWDAMQDFFGERVAPLIQKVVGKVQESPSLKPSKATQPRTRKRSKNS